MPKWMDLPEENAKLKAECDRLREALRNSDEFIRNIDGIPYPTAWKRDRFLVLAGNVDALAEPEGGESRAETLAQGPDVPEPKTDWEHLFHESNNKRIELQKDRDRLTEALKEAREALAALVDRAEGMELDFGLVMRIHDLQKALAEPEGHDWGSPEGKRRLANIAAELVEPEGENDGD